MNLFFSIITLKKSRISINRKSAIAIMFLSISFSCNQAKETGIKRADNKGTEIKKKGIENFGEPFLVEDFKKEYQKNSTTGVTSKSKSLEFCSFNENGFYGTYSLFDNELKYHGEMIIFTTDNPEKWTFKSKNEVIVEIISENKEMKLWGKNWVGLRKEKIISIIGSNSYFHENEKLFADFGDYNVEFLLNTDTVNKVIATKKCN